MLDLLPEIMVRPAFFTDNLLEIARLIMQTDPYIYPVAFGKKGLPVLTEMISNNTTVFGYSRIIVAVSGDRILGQMVMIDDQPVELINADKYLEPYPMLPDAFRHTTEQYFNHLPGYVSNQDELYVACVSVDKHERGKGIGSALISYLIRNYPGKAIKLHVLVDNLAARALYEAHGFRVEGDAVPGYAYQQIPPLCYEMIRAIP